MAKTELASSSCAILCLLLLSFPNGEISMLVHAHIITQQISTPATPITWTTWCVANPSADEKSINRNINYSCDKISCEIIRPGGFCFYPNTVAHHASLAFNAYYRLNGATPRDCYFNDTALIALSDPSYGGCHFVESQSKPPKDSVEKEDTWCVAKPGTSEKTLQANIDYVCRRESKHCNVIQKRGSCFYPNTRINHASVLMNFYYKTRANFTCDFNNTGLIVMTSPNYGNCIYV